MLADFKVAEDFKTWDPRIKQVEFCHNKGSWVNGLQIKVTLHCNIQIGWAMLMEIAQAMPSKDFWLRFRKEIQPEIETAYAKMRELAGGTVDVYGKLLVKPKIVEVSFMSETKQFEPLFEVVDLTPEEEWNHWCSQVNLDLDYEDNEAYKEYFNSQTTSIGIQDVATIVQANLLEICPGLRELVDCPACATFSMPLKNIIIHLNDIHKWTRMDVADWIESLDIDTEFKE